MGEGKQNDRGSDQNSERQSEEVDNLSEEMERKLRLSHRKGPVVKLNRDYYWRKKNEWQFALVGKIKDDWQPSNKLVETTVQNLWRPEGPMQVFICEERKFIFKMQKEEDMRRVLKDGPWTIQGAFLMLRPLPLNIPVELIRFDCVAVWIKVEGLPFGFYDKEAATAIGQSAGRVIEVDVKMGALISTNQMRIRVEVDAEGPLMPGTYIEDEDVTITWVTFTYERVQRFCYRCGHIGHTESGCQRDYYNAKEEIQKSMEKLNAGQGNRWMEDTGFNLYSRKNTVEK